MSEAPEKGQKRVSLIATYLKKSRGMGYQGKFPWYLIYEDMYHFRSKTVGSMDGIGGMGKNAVIMGRNTWEGIKDKNGMGLNRRVNIISKGFECPETSKMSKSIDDALQFCDSNDFIKDVWMIGGVEIYREAMNNERCKDLWLTELERVDGIVPPSDRVFPDVPSCYIDVGTKNVLTVKDGRNDEWTMTIRHLVRH